MPRTQAATAETRTPVPANGHGLKPAQIEAMLAGGIDRFPPPYQSLFRANSEAYSAYLPLAQELAGRE